MCVNFIWCMEAEPQLTGKFGTFSCDINMISGFSKRKSIAFYRKRKKNDRKKGTNRIITISRLDFHSEKL